MHESIARGVLRNLLDRCTLRIQLRPSSSMPSTWIQQFQSTLAPYAYVYPIALFAGHDVRHGNYTCVQRGISSPRWKFCGPSVSTPPILAEALHASSSMGSSSRPGVAGQRRLVEDMPKASKVLQVLVLWHMANMVAAGPRRSGRAVDLAQPDTLSASEIQTAYRIMDTTNPFPAGVMLRVCPLAWRVAQALGRATSLHPSCVFVHLLILVATTLHAVQIKFGGILGRFCNLLMIQHGAPGEGKSVALWLSLQILYYYDKVRESHAKRKHAQKMQIYRQWKENGSAEPAMEEPAK